MTTLIEPYNSNWKTEFENLKTVLQKALVGFALDIQHVGSTAVPDLCAKPILDIDIIIDNKILLNELSARLEKIGYINRGEQGIVGRFAFRQASELTPYTTEGRKWQAHHLYVCFFDSLALKNHLLFRDALLNDQVLVRAYSQLKKKLTAQEGMTRENYTIQKTDFIISVLKNIGLDENELNEIIKANT